MNEQWRLRTLGHRLLGMDCGFYRGQQMTRGSQGETLKGMSEVKIKMPLFLKYAFHT